DSDRRRIIIALLVDDLLVVRAARVDQRVVVVAGLVGRRVVVTLILVDARPVVGAALIDGGVRGRAHALVDVAFRAGRAGPLNDGRAHVAVRAAVDGDLVDRGLGGCGLIHGGLSVVAVQEVR